MKKLLVVAGVGLMLVLGWVFLIHKEQEEGPPSQVSPVKQQISLYHYFSGSLSGGISEMVSVVNNREGDFEVEARALDHEAFKSMIHTTLTQGEPPELFTYWAGAKTQELVDKNQLEPIDDLWLREELDSRFAGPITEAASTYNGRKYLLPITQHFVAFFYNLEIFQKYNLSPPDSWESFVTLCRRLQEAGLTPIALGARERWPAQFWFDYLLLRTAGPEYRDALMRGRAAYTDPEVRRAYALWADLLQQGYFNQDANALDWAEATEKICTRQAAMTLMGTWIIQRLTDDSCALTPGTDFDFFVFPLIDPTVPKTAVGPIDGLVLTKNSANHEFAKSVLAYFAEKEPQQLMSEGSGALAPSGKVPPGFYSPFKQKILAEIQATPHWAFNYDLATPLAAAEKGMDSFNELIAFPDQYEAILDNLEKEISTIIRLDLEPDVQRRQ